MRYKICVLFLLLMVGRVHAVEVQPDEMKMAQRFAQDRIAWLTSPQMLPSPEVKLIEQGWGTLHFGWSVNHRVLQLKGKQFQTGFGSHADAAIEYALPTDAKRLTGSCGIDDTEEARANPHPVEFSIAVDGKAVWHSKPQSALDAASDFDVDVSQGKSVTFIAKGTSGDLTYTPADFVDLQLTLADGSKKLLGQRVDPIKAAGPGISYRYGEKSSEDFLNSWALEQKDLAETDFYTQKQFTRTDPATGLQCVVVIKQYKLFPVVEWSLNFKNTGSKDTPILENIRSMDLVLSDGDQIMLHHHTGDYANEDSYEPHQVLLKTGDTLRFAPQGGRPTDKAWPYFNLENTAEHCGIITVLGWPGQWAASFARSAEKLEIDAGQEVTHFVLHPGESARAPISVFMFYQGDSVRSQNLWRKWMLEENMPRPGGKVPMPINAASLGLHQSAKTEINGINLFTANGAGINYWWMDAGWYPCTNWWDGVGSWYPDPVRFPQGVKQVSDVAHAKGLKLILWLEPERAVPGSDLYKNHPEFLLGKDGADKLFNLGDPAAWNWMVNHIDDLINTQSIDLYRQDFNEEALGFWRANDAADRQGITEMRHVEGYLHLWDQLHARHPDLIIDTCASGGRRLDLETLRRSIPLWRSDDSENTEHNQCQTYGLASWVPLYGTGTSCNTAYTIRSDMLPFFTLGMGPDGKEPDWNLYRREKANWAKINPDLIGDYYPLLPYTRDMQAWIAWQFDRPDLGTGVVQAFRRPGSPYEAGRFRLNGLEPDAHYRITDLDQPDKPEVLLGKQLMEDGLKVRMDTAPMAALISYLKQ